MHSREREKGSSAYNNVLMVTCTGSRGNFTWDTEINSIEEKKKSVLGRLTLFKNVSSKDIAACNVWYKIVGYM